MSVPTRRRAVRTTSWALLLWVAHVHGLPGHRTSAWGLAEIGAAGLSVSVVVLAVACAVVPTAGSSGPPGSTGTLRP